MTLRGKRAGLRSLLALALAVGCATGRPEEIAEAVPADVALPALEVGARPPARVVLVTVSGLTPAQYLATPESAPPMTMLASLASSGAAAERVVPVAPASTYPAHATLVTGRTPSHHGVTMDRLPGDHGTPARRPTPRSPLRVPALWEAVADAGRRSVVLGWPGSSGGRIDLVFPESFPLEPGEEWSTWLSLHASPGLLDAARHLGGEAPANAGPGKQRDHLLVGLACEVLRSPSPPALLLLHLSQTEPPLLMKGPGSPEAAAAFSSVDRELARLVGCLRESGFLESTALLVAGDHGVAPVRSSVSPNVVLREKGLIVPEVDGAGTKRWSALSRSNGGSAFVYARTEADAKLARRALYDESVRTRAFQIVSARELMLRGVDPEAWFGLEAEDGFWIDDAVSGPLVREAPVRGTWGSLRAGAASPGFVAWGAGVRSSARIPTMKQADVAPTAAVLLGFELGALDGAPVAALLALPAVAAKPQMEPLHVD